MSIRLQHRRDTAANWTAANPILAEGEMGLETDTIKYKIGDGSTLWAALGYFQLDTYTHPTGDGNLHVPATSNTNDGKALSVGATEGSYSWTSITALDMTLDVVTQADSNTHTRLGVGAGSAIAAQDTATGFYTMFGYRAGNAITKPSGSLSGVIAIGYKALEIATVTSGHTVIGANSCKNVSSSNLNNTTIGAETGFSLSTIGHYNTLIGIKSGYSISNAQKVTAIGTEAGYLSSTMNYATCIGFNAGRSAGGSYGTFIGAFSNYGAVTGSYNTTVGYRASYNATGNHGRNTVVGFNAMEGSGTQTVNDNTAIGRNTLRNAGIQALSRNTAVGENAGYFVDLETNQTLLGCDAGYNSSLGDSTFIGYSAGIGNSIGNVLGTIAIGSATNGNTGTAGGQIVIGRACSVTPNIGQQIVIGTSLVGTTINRVSIGNSTNYIYADYNTAATWTYTSDERTKNFHRNSRLGLEFINALQPKEFTWKLVAEWPTEFGKTDCAEMDSRLNHGLAAQAIKAAMDACGVEDFAGWGLETNGMQTVGETALVFPLINAIKELNKRITYLEVL